MWRIPFRDGAFPHTVDSLSSGSILHAADISPSGGSISHAAVAKAMLPSSRSTPPGHAAVLRCGMCCFAGEVMYSTVLVVVGCADISGCSTVISLLTNTNTISHNLSIHITSYPPL